MKTLLNVVVKEARELFTPHALAPMLIVLVIYGVIGRAIRSEREKQSGPQAVLLVDRDESGFGATVSRVLDQSGFIVLPAGTDTEAALALAREDDVAWVVVVPEGTGAAVAARADAELETYGVFQGFSVAQMVKGAQVRGLLQALNDELLRERVREAWPGEDPVRMMRALSVRPHVVVRERVAEGGPELLGELVMAQTFLIPVVLLMVIIIASQMIAASVGQEKENKTLETLLTVPVSRLTLVAGKMLGAALFALVASAMFMAAMASYMGAFAPEATGAGAALLAELGLRLGWTSWFLLGLVLFLSVLCALGLVTVLAAFADDARSAQLATTPVMVLVMLPFFLTTFFDIQVASTAVRVLVYAQPFSYPFLVPRALLFGEYAVVWGGLAFLAVFAALMVFIAAKLYSGDRILTARLSLRRR
ncbi:MAG TPA: ABC transporter permease [candidate division WOR-3 bacterium]|uniref:ABC transporter permease n=1 Tax=candidate division WOR-3 bacterium TaxID=2052148 RepID=A0A7V0XGA5_UNCW3|nr:ABC transporter permease [candidate division WOR-3 bacterium]